MHSAPGEFRTHSNKFGHPISAFTAALLLLLAGAAQAQLVIPGNNGQDLAFAPNANVQVDLSLAVTGEWDTTNSTGQGVYDPEQWAVIFRYTSVTIPSNVTVTFKNHPSRAPVIWLVQGNVSIAGIVSLNGANGHGVGPAATHLSEPGPGGFRGGRGVRSGVLGSGGFGPGGAGYPASSENSASGSYSTVGYAWAPAAAGATYGNDGLFPLIGGSGGAGRPGHGGGGGGAGGGAILIGAAETIALSGQIRASGGASGENGAGGGSGGGIRLIADIVEGSGVLSAVGGSSGGAGRIRVEANTITLTAAQVDSSGTPTTPPRIFREPGDGVPSIKSMTLNGQAVPDDPASYPTQDVALLGVEENDNVTLVITAEYVPDGSTVSARVVRISGVEEVIPAIFDGSSVNESTWNAEIPVAGGFSTIQVHAVLP